MNSPLECIITEPKKLADSCVIWLHGLGADGHDFEGVLPELGLPETHRIRFIFPHAPMRPITINQHMLMRGWFDIYSLNSLEQVDNEGIETSSQQVQQLIQTQLDSGILSHRIILAGFSQGGVIALHLGMTQTQPIAGIIGLSTYLPFVRDENHSTTITHNNTPILMCHGAYDDIIPESLGKETFLHLKNKGFSPIWHEYSMGHQVCSEELRLIGSWLAEVLLSAAK